MADGGVNGFDYRTRTRDLGTPGRLLGPYFGPKSFPSHSGRDPVNPQDRRHLQVRHRAESRPTSSGVTSDIERSHVRHRVESRPTSSGTLTDDYWDPGDRCHGYSRWRREKVVGERCRKVEK